MGDVDDFIPTDPDAFMVPALPRMPDGFMECTQCGRVFQGDNTFPNHFVSKQIAAGPPIVYEWYHKSQGIIHTELVPVVCGPLRELP
jgi:hypothetical protein